MFLLTISLLQAATDRAPAPDPPCCAGGSVRLAYSGSGLAAPATTYQLQVATARTCALCAVRERPAVQHPVRLVYTGVNRIVELAQFRA